MPTFKIQGQIYHKVGSLLPDPNEEPKFLQIYFLGGEDELNRGSEIQPSINRKITGELQVLLHERNHLIRSLKTAVGRHGNQPDFKVIIRAAKVPNGEHAGRYNAPSCSEVAILIVDEQAGRRDIVIRKHDDTLQKIMETNIAYDALQYPLLFWQGEDGYGISIPKTNTTSGQLNLNKKISSNDFYAY